MRSIVVVGTFESRPEAEQAAELLQEQGIARGDIDIRSEAVEAPPTARTEETGTSWWDWLFGESEQRSYYSDSLRSGGAVLAVSVDDPAQAEHVRELMQEEGGDVDVDEPTPRATTEGADTVRAERTAAADQEAVVPVTEERLRIGKRPVSQGGVRVYRRQTERPVDEHVRLREEHVNVERRPVDRPVGQGADAFRDQVIEITEMAEEAVVAKDVRIVEEVVVTKDVSERDEVVRDRVRRSEVEVERFDAQADEEFRRHWAASPRSEEQTYEQYDPAYRFGHQLSGESDANQWSMVESDVQRRWEEGHPGTWERFKGAIRHAWEGGRDARRRAA